MAHLHSWRDRRNSSTKFLYRQTSKYLTYMLYIHHCHVWLLLLLAFANLTHYGYFCVSLCRVLVLPLLCRVGGHGFDISFAQLQLSGLQICSRCAIVSKSLNQTTHLRTDTNIILECYVFCFFYALSSLNRQILSVAYVDVYAWYTVLISGSWDYPKCRADKSTLAALFPASAVPWIGLAYNTVALMKIFSSLMHDPWYL